MTNDNSNEPKSLQKARISMDSIGREKLLESRISYSNISGGADSRISYSNISDKSRVQAKKTSEK